MKAKYSIRAILHLARNQGNPPVQIKDIADKEAIPHKFLERILVDLRNVGLLQSKMGKFGGYYLERSPDTISLSTVIRMIDGPLAPVPCVSQTAYAKCKDCFDEKSCVIRTVMKEVRNSTAKILDETTFQDLLTRENALAKGEKDIDFVI